ncbi:hypothetical protein Tco_0690724 [Tanacetum coccineum]
MPPKSAPLTQAAIRRMIKESVDAAIAAERARHANAGNDARGSGPVRGQDVAPAVRECTFAGFMKCNPTAFHEGKKVKFATATLQGPALTWWNAKLMTIEFCPIEEVQRMVHELWNLKVKEYNIVAYTQSSMYYFLLEEFFGELALNRPIPPGIIEADFDPKGDIRFIENLIEGHRFMSILHMPRDPELVQLLGGRECSLKKDGEIDTAILLTIKDVFASEKLLKWPLGKLSCDISLPSIDCFTLIVEPDSGDFHYDLWMEDILMIQLGEQEFMCLMFYPPIPPFIWILDVPLCCRVKDFNPPLYELPFHKEVPGLGALLSFSSENKEKVFNPGILTSKRVHSSLLPKLSHRGPKAFKVIKICESPMEIFPCSYGDDIRILDVPCLHFYPS